jgi:hypothetical protein
LRQRLDFHNNKIITTALKIFKDENSLVVVMSIVETWKALQATSPTGFTVGVFKWSFEGIAENFTNYCPALLLPSFFSQSCTFHPYLSHRFFTVLSRRLHGGTRFNPSLD